MINGKNYTFRYPNNMDNSDRAVFESLFWIDLRGDDNAFESAVQLAARYAYLKKMEALDLMDDIFSAKEKVYLINELSLMLESLNEKPSQSKEVVNIELSFDNNDIGKQNKQSTLEKISQILGISASELKAKTVANS